ncbi:MAG: hypothetical protein GTN97_03550 [Nitrosopumilaceae archaeon]|nr:hypothetical protein [Nitrosopumilaceae archaeon]
MTKQAQLKQEVCPEDGENMKSLHYLKRKYLKNKEIGTWQKAQMKICPKCGLIMFYKKSVKYVIYPDTDKVKILK